MSIVAFHRVLITVAVGFFALFAWWELARYQDDGEGLRLALGIVSALLAVALAVYLALLNRFLGRKGV
jgi:hypothetical protein